MGSASVLIALAIIGDPLRWPDGVIPPPPKANPGYLEDDRPLWLLTAIAANRNAAERYGHKLDVQQLPGPDFLAHQREFCETKPADQPNGPFHRRSCYQGAHRNNCTWYKFRMILDYLVGMAAEYVLFVDCDAFVMMRQDHDPVQRMVDTMNDKGVDIMVADEDWRGAVGATNTGVVLVRNCNWTRRFFAEILSLRETTCRTNEQACFRALVAADRPPLSPKSHVHIASGLRWNRHPQDRRDPGNVKLDWDTNPATEIVHFMGGAKSGLHKIDVLDNGVCPADAGCVDVDHCAAAAVRRDPPPAAGKKAFAFAEPLLRPPGQRFLGMPAMRAALAEAKTCGADVVFVVPRAGVAAHPLTAAERTVLQSHGFVIREAPWVTPPGADAGNCGGRPLLGLHALALEGYGAVVLLGDGLVVRREVASLFGCAASTAADGSRRERLLHAARGGTGVVAFRPSASLLEAAVRAAATLRLPNGGGNVTSDCGAVFASAALCGAAGGGSGGGAAGDDASLPACHAIDPCKWSRVPSDSGDCDAVHIPCDAARFAHVTSCGG